MYKNYFTLSRHISELNLVLSNSTLEQSFTQEKDKLILKFSSQHQETYLEINTNPLLPYIIQRFKFNRAKKNTLAFFQKYLPSKLDSLQIAFLDRIVEFNFKDFSIYFFFRGQDTNVLLLDKMNKIESFKKIKNENIVEEIKNQKYINSFPYPNIEIDPGENWIEQLQKSYPFLGKNIIGELKLRLFTNPSMEKKEILLKILKDIEFNRPFIIKEKSKSYQLSFFKESYNANEIIKEFENVNEALQFLIFQNKIERQSNSIKDSFAINLKEKINKLELKRIEIQKRIKAAADYTKYQKIAQILSVNRDKLKTGLSKIILPDLLNINETLTIELSPKFKPQENIDHYFDKAKSEKRSFEKNQELLKKIDGEILQLKNKLAESHSLVSEDALPPKSDSKNFRPVSQKIKGNFRRFLLHKKYIILVGKNSKSNDELTMNYAKTNDLWFHARDVSGSHVVLKYEASFGDIQKNVLEKAAAIAAYYSKAKTSGVVPVSYTQKKYVVKRKGMPAGKVLLLKERVLLVKPGIPKECELITEL